jgi:ribosomal-protein-alanine N-acetyltransferase
MLTVQFDSFPVLETNRLRLRHITEADAEALFALRTNDAVMQYIGRPKPQNLEEVKSMIEKIKTDFKESVGISWVIAHKESDELIGTIGFWRMDKQNHRAEIGYMLHSDYWGKGIATEAMQAVLPYGFDVLRFHSIEANVDPLNEVSKKLLLKFGFVQEAYFRENYYFDGQFLDSAIFCLLQHDYKKI